MDREKLRKFGVKDIRTAENGESEALLTFQAVHVELPTLYIEYIALCAERWNIAPGLALFNLVSLGIEAMKLGLTVEQAERYIDRQLKLIKSQGF